MAGPIVPALERSRRDRRRAERHHRFPGRAAQAASGTLSAHWAYGEKGWPVAQHILALDGSTITVSCSKRTVQSHGSTRIAVFDGQFGEREFTAGGKQLGSELAARDGITLDEEYALPQGGRCRFGTLSAVDSVSKLEEFTVLGVWEGKDWSVSTWLPGGTPEMMLSIFSMFEFREGESGVEMVSKSEAAMTMSVASGRAPSVVCYVDGLGLMTGVERTAAQEWQVPKSPGVPAAGGRVWIETLVHPEGGEATVFFHVVSDTAISLVQPEVSEVAEQDLISRCADLVVTWAH